MHGAMGAFPASKICYIEAKRRDKILHLSDGRTEEVVNTLDEMEEKLEPYGFCRVHKGYLVNLALVDSIYADEVEIRGERIPISRSRSKAVRLAYMNYLNQANAIMLGGPDEGVDLESVSSSHLKKH